MKHVYQVKMPEAKARKCVGNVFSLYKEITCLRESSSQNVVDDGGHYRDGSEKSQTIFHLNILD